LLANPAEPLERPADHGRASALQLTRARRQHVGILGQGRVAVFGSDLGQHREPAAERGGTAPHLPRRAPPFLARLPAPQAQRRDADPEAPRHLGMTATPRILAGQQRALAQVR
jgi:hypothetical protein